MTYKIHIVSLVLCIGCCSVVFAQRRDGKIRITKGSYGREARSAGAKQGVDEKTKNILAQFLKMFNNFFSIVQDPHNPAVVTDGITNMLAGAVNIIAEGIKLGELSLDADETEIQAYAHKVSKKISLPLVRFINQ